MTYMIVYLQLSLSILLFIDIYTNIA